MDILTVFGATGLQGSGLVRAALADPRRRFHVRAVTRRPSSAPAQALARDGAELCQADLDDAADVRRALRGAAAAWCLTSYREHRSPAREVEQAHAMAQAALDAGVRHVVWSTCEDTRRYVEPGSGTMPVLQQRYNVPSFDGKGEGDRAFIDRGVPTTLLYPSPCWEDLIHAGIGPRRRADGELALFLPIGNRSTPWIAAEDIGRCAYAIFRRGSELIGKSIGIAGAHLTGIELAAGLSWALGERVRYEAVTPERYRALGFPRADELANLWQFMRDFDESCRSRRSLDVSRDLHPGMQTFQAWLAYNGARIPGREAAA